MAKERISIVSFYTICAVLQHWLLFKHGTSAAPTETLKLCVERAECTDLPRTQGDIAVCQDEADTLQYEYRGLGDAHADAGNQFIPVTTRSSEHTSSIGRCSVKFAEVVMQGLEQRLVDRNGMALFRVVVITPSRIPNPGNNKLCARLRAGFTSEPSLRLATVASDTRWEILYLLLS